MSEQKGFTIADIDENYNEDEDEDFVPDKADCEDDEAEARKRAALLNPFSKPVKKSTSGAQVLEDDDEDLYNMNDVLPQQVRMTRSKLKDDSGEMYELEEVKKSDNAAAMWALMNADDNDMKLKRKAESSKDELANLMKQKKKKQKTTDGKAKAKAKAKKGKKGDKKKKKKKVLNSWELPDQGSSLQDLFKKKKAEDKVEEKTEKVTEGSSLPSSSPSSSPVADSTTGAVKPTFGVTEVTDIKLMAGMQVVEDKAKGLIIAKEIKEYAGQKIEVTRTIQAGSEQEKAFRAEMAANKKKSNLENILNSLQAKNNMNTLDKTRVDWGVSKEIEGDQQALTQSTKDGYLEKQNFLQRTEDIAYMKKKEIEKKKRSEKHAIEAMKEAKKGAL